MVDKRNRILSLINYLTSLGIEVNYNKNKARGKKGYFKTNSKFFRIDISKELNSDEALPVLLHEFGHFIHYQYDNSLKSLEFIFDKYDDSIINELIELTVNLISKNDVTKLMESQKTLNKEINSLVQLIKLDYPEFKKTQRNYDIENVINKKGIGYLLKHDKVKIINMFSTQLLDIDNVDKYFNNNEQSILAYLKLKSKYRMLKRINSRISKLNNYYNSPTELFARAFETFFITPDIMQKKAPNVYQFFITALKDKKIKYLNECKTICNV